MTPECGRCGGTVAPDGRCWDCGASQPGFRARIEIATGGGAGVSDRGGRGVNADALGLDGTSGWTAGVVCDGVSMSPRGDRAAQVAAETGTVALVAALRAGALPEDALDQAAVRADRAVRALAGADRPAPACTFVAGAVGTGGLWVGWIGDSRAYWLPDEGPAMALTEDDSDEDGVMFAWLGADAPSPSPRGRSHHPSTPGLLLLCTDGLWQHFAGPADLRAALRAKDPPQAARRLVQLALDAGARDNVTALLLAVEPEPGAGNRKP